MNLGTFQGTSKLNAILSDIDGGRSAPRYQLFADADKMTLIMHAPGVDPEQFVCYFGYRCIALVTLYASNYGITTPLHTRTFTLPDNINPFSATEHAEKGRYTITIPLNEPAELI